MNYRDFEYRVGDIVQLRPSFFRHPEATRYNFQEYDTFRIIANNGEILQIVDEDVEAGRFKLTINKKFVCPSTVRRTKEEVLEILDKFHTTDELADMLTNYGDYYYVREEDDIQSPLSIVSDPNYVDVRPNEYNLDFSTME